jgi:hypothetical protein
MTNFVKPDLPSAVVRFTGDEAASIPPAFNQVVAITGISDWGPLGTQSEGTKLYTSLAKFEEDYGTNMTPARIAVLGAFNGMGVTGGDGAGGVIFHRLAAASAAKASKVINQTGAGSTAALTLTALYPGTRGNALSYVVEDDPVSATRDRLRILLNGAQVESFTYDATDITGLQTIINARPSRYVVASGAVSGVALAASAGTPLTGGDDGASVGAAQFLTAQRSLEYKDFGIFSPAGLTDVAVKNQLAEWQRGMENNMRPIRLVLGGATAETIDQAMAELSANPGLKDPNIVRFAVGDYHDELIDLDLNTAQLAPRIAGVLAARGEMSALTRAKLGGLTPVGAGGATLDELKIGRDAGLTMLRQVSSPDAQLAVSQGVTTFTSKTTKGRPYMFYSEPRIVGLLHRIVRQLVQWGEEVVIGTLGATDATRNLVRAQVLKVLGELESSGLAEPGSSFVTVDKPEDPQLRDAIPYEFGFMPTLTANYVIGNGRIR